MEEGYGWVARGTNRHKQIPQSTEDSSWESAKRTYGRPTVFLLSARPLHPVDDAASICWVCSFQRLQPLDGVVEAPSCARSFIRVHVRWIQVCAHERSQEGSRFSKGAAGHERQMGTYVRASHKNGERTFERILHRLDRTHRVSVLVGPRVRVQLHGKDGQQLVVLVEDTCGEDTGEYIRHPRGSPACRTDPQEPIRRPRRCPCRTKSHEVDRLKRGVAQVIEFEEEHDRVASCSPSRRSSSVSAYSSLVCCKANEEPSKYIGVRNLVFGKRILLCPPAVSPRAAGQPCVALNFSSTNGTAEELETALEDAVDPFVFFFNSLHYFVSSLEGPL